MYAQSDSFVDFHDNNKGPEQTAEMLIWIMGVGNHFFSPDMAHMFSYTC